MDLIFAAGLAYSILSVPFIALQLVTLAVFASQSEYRQLTCYRIMFSIGLADTAQLLVHAISGMAMMCGYQFTAAWAANLLGAVLCSAWIAMVPQHTVLAINRLMVVADGAAEHVTSTRERCVANVCPIRTASVECTVGGF
jgi:Serpentine type 7TM GPCR chemoreceptor Srt